MLCFFLILLFNLPVTWAQVQSRVTRTTTKLVKRVRKPCQRISVLGLITLQLAVVHVKSICPIFSFWPWLYPQPRDLWRVLWSPVLTYHQCVYPPYQMMGSSSRWFSKWSSIASFDALFHQIGASVVPLPSPFARRKRINKVFKNLSLFFWQVTKDWLSLPCHRDS